MCSTKFIQPQGHVLLTHVPFYLKKTFANKIFLDVVAIPRL